MFIYLCDVSEQMCEAWANEFADIDGAEILCGSIFNCPADALVSPANSFGFMDGALDAMITEQLGTQVQDRVRDLLAREFYGELLVGQAVIVPTDHEHFPYLISAPTMRTPAALPADTVNPYLATRAVLRLLMDNIMVLQTGEEVPIRDVIETIAISGLGTGVGQVPYEVCARQMHQAVVEVLIDGNPMPRDWDDVTDRFLDLTARPEVIA